MSSDQTAGRMPATTTVFMALMASASGLLVSLKPHHLSPRAPRLRMTESAKTPLRDQLPREGAISLDAPACGADRARRGAIQAFCAWAIGPLAGAAAAMASDEATVTELAERLELYEARAREAERVALAKDAELKQKLAELSQLSDGDAPNAPALELFSPPAPVAPPPPLPLPAPLPSPLPSPPPPPAPAVESFPFSWATPKPAPLPAVAFPSFSYESWTPPPPLNQLFVSDEWNRPTAAVLGFGLAAAAVSTAGAMRSGGKDSYAHQGQQQGYPPQGGQQAGYPGQRGQQQGYPPPQGQQGQGQGQQGQGSYQRWGQGQQGQQGQRGQGQQGGYAPQGGSLGSAANPVIPDGARWAPSAPMGTPGNPVVGTVIGTPAVKRGNPGAARREVAASVDELLDLMEDYREDPQQGFRQVRVRVRVRVR